MKFFLFILSMIAFIGCGNVRVTVVPNDDKQETIIDVVIPCAFKDFETLNLCIAGIKKYGKNIRRVIVISKLPLTDAAEFFPEDSFPFTKMDLIKVIVNDDQKLIDKYIKHPKNIASWIYQQLLKLYAFKVIPNISDNILILDADTIFLNRTEFFDSENQPIFSLSKENHENYVKHARKLIPNLVKEQNSTGIAHCMIFQRKYISQMFEEVETRFDKPFWRAFCSCIDKNSLDEPCASEYWMYYHYLLTKESPISNQNFKWRNISNLSKLRRCKSQKFNYVSSHAYLRFEWQMKDVIRDEK